MIVNVDLSKEEIERVKLWFELARLNKDVNDIDIEIYSKLKGDG